MRLVSIAMLVLIGTPAFAQQPSIAEPPRCWLGGLSYSPGATIRAGNGVMACGADLAWTPTTDEAAGCVRDGTFYGTGAVHNASAGEPLVSRCRPDGTWVGLWTEAPGTISR